MSEWVQINFGYVYIIIILIRIDYHSSSSSSSSSSSINRDSNVINREPPACLAIYDEVVVVRSMAHTYTHKDIHSSAALVMAIPH